MQPSYAQQCVQGQADFTFSLVYTSLEEVLPRIESLLAVARLDDSKEGVQQAAQQLAGLIKVRFEAAVPKVGTDTLSCTCPF